MTFSPVYFKATLIWFVCPVIQPAFIVTLLPESLVYVLQHQSLEGRCEGLSVITDQGMVLGMISIWNKFYGDKMKIYNI